MPLSPRSLVDEARRAPGNALVLAGLLVAAVVTPAVFAPGLYDDFTLVKQASLLVATALILAGLAWDGEFLPRSPIVRRLLVAWTVLLSGSFFMGIDSRGSVLGYYQYRQGLLTQVAYVALFVGSSKVTRETGWGWLGPAGIAGLASVTAYTTVQAAGQDPVNWWVDTSARAIGTIGNANELAAYAVIALAFCGFGARYSRRTATVWTVVVAAWASFIVLESESRSGLLALGTAFIAFPLAGAVLGERWRRWARQWLLLLGGLATGAVLSTLAGGAAGTADRVQAGLVQSQTSGSTRTGLWKGTAPVIAASPLIGFGPDGLHLAFPRHRPADLGGAFSDYNLVAQSSHNAVLDVAANQGIPALIALVSMLGLVAVRSVRCERRPRDPGTPFVWAAMTGYVALILVNPVSLAPHALFFILAGALNGRAEGRLPSTRKPLLPSPLRLALVSPALLGLFAVAALMPLADIRANSAWTHFAEQDFDFAAEDYAAAHRLIPFERVYAAAVAESWLAAGVDGGEGPLRAAAEAYETFDDEFGFSSGEAIGLITARIGLSDAPGLDALIDRSLSLNPHGVSMISYTATLRTAAATGGTLHYAKRDRWVYVEPTANPTTR